ncbi:putative RNA-directed DNA polymerase, eukaryota, reverse transcriptase zinc-binding domain protein, partial [Tanacetum coccineum]
SSNLIHRINLGSPDLTLSHLFYGDDVIITTEWNPGDLDNIIRVLHVFYLASGLEININKTDIYGIGVSYDEVSNMARNSRCVAGSFPFTYLGLPIGSTMNRISSWKTLIDWFQSRRSSWKASLLSIGGTLTLIKAVLGSLRIYYLSIFKASEIILKSLESLRAKFLWGGQDSKKLIWIKWANVLSSFEKGRLNIGSLKSFNLIGDSPLNIRYNRLYRLELDKDCLIIDRIKNGQWSWNWSRNDLGVCNTTYFRDLLIEISRVDISTVEDTCIWSLAKDDIFSVKETRRVIDDKILLSSATSTSWDKTLPRKVNIFMWRLMLDWLPHRLNLSSCRIDIQSILCPSCNGNVESSNIFFECDIALEV